MTRTTVNASTVLGANYEIITLEPNNYNPQIDDDITITCTVQDVYGDPVANKSVTLYQDGTSEGTETTGNTGAATWTITFSDWDVHHFNVGNATLDLKAEGWRQLKTFGTTGVVKTNGEYVYIYCADAISNVTSRQTRGIGTVTTGYEPPSVFAVEASQDQAANHKFIVGTNGNISVSNATTSTTTIQVFNSIIYPLI